MEQEVESNYRTVCTTCLSSDRNLVSLNGVSRIYEVFRLIMYDFTEMETETMDIEQYICWECLALMKRFLKFKQQVHQAQEHLRMLAMSQTQEGMDHTYMSQSMSCLEVTLKQDYDQLYMDYTAEETAEWPQQYITISSTEDVKSEQFNVAQAVRDNINIDIDANILEVPEIVLEGDVMSHIVVASDALDQYTVKGEVTEIAVEVPKQEVEISKLTPKHDPVKKYIMEYMSQSEMLAVREEAKQKVQYASALYKCELCIVGFYAQQHVEDHFLNTHRAKDGHVSCKICYAFVSAASLATHTAAHYERYTCRLCARTELSEQLMELHVRTHAARAPPASLVRLAPAPRQKKKKKEAPSEPPKPGDLRKLLSKTTIEGYQCLECDMFFKNSRARRSHVARFHREKLQCDHCKKRFASRTTLATHLKLHSGPLPRGECPVCHKMVRVEQLKTHVRRHQTAARYECSDCNKMFSHHTTYQAHLKYSRAHANENVLKFPCPMCNKGYPTKEAMQDHFNYQHLGKTNHKCPICDKPISSRVNVEKHMMRVHSDKKEKPRNHHCPHCSKAFTDRKALRQHVVIHSGERPIVCDVCQQTFKQKASFYTHRKRVHKLFPPKREVEFISQDK